MIIRIAFFLIASLFVIDAAGAELTSEDVHKQITELLAERRFENDRRLESLEKLVAASDNAIRQLIDQQSRYNEAQLRSLRERLDAASASSKEMLDTARSSRSAELAVQFSALKDSITKTEGSNKLAVDKAEASNEKRFESVNEFRAQLKDQQALLMPRAESDVKSKLVADSLTALTQRLDQISGRGQGIDAFWSALVAATGLLIGIAGVVAAVFRHRRSD